MGNEQIKDLIEEWIDEREGNIYPQSFNKLDLEQLAAYILIISKQLS